MTEWFSDNLATVQGIAAGVSVLVTGVLVGVTLWYARINREMLDSQRVAALRDFEPLVVARQVRYEAYGACVKYRLANMGKGTAFIWQVELILSGSQNDILLTDTDWVIPGEETLAQEQSISLERALAEGDTVGLQILYRNVFGRDTFSYSSYALQKDTFRQQSPTSIAGSLIYGTSEHGDQLLEPRRKTRYWSAPLRRFVYKKLLRKKTNRFDYL